MCPTLFLIGVAEFQMKDGCLGEERLSASGVDDSHLPVPQAMFCAVCLPSRMLALPLCVVSTHTSNCCMYTVRKKAKLFSILKLIETIEHNIKLGSYY